MNEEIEAAAEQLRQMKEARARFTKESPDVA